MSAGRFLTLSAGDSRRGKRLCSCGRRKTLSGPYKSHHGFDIHPGLQVPRLRLARQERQLWNIAEGTAKESRRRSAAPVFSVAVSPDGALLLLRTSI